MTNRGTIWTLHPSEGPHTTKQSPQGLCREEGGAPGLHTDCVLVRGNPPALLGSHIPIELSTHSPRNAERGRGREGAIRGRDGGCEGRGWVVGGSQKEERWGNTAQNRILNKVIINGLHDNTLLRVFSKDYLCGNLIIWEQGQECNDKSRDDTLCGSRGSCLR